MNESMLGYQPGYFVKSAEEVVREKMLREENKVLHARCVKALRRELSVLSHVPKEVIGIFLTLIKSIPGSVFKNK